MNVARNLCANTRTPFTGNSYVSTVLHDTYVSIVSYGRAAPTCTQRIGANEAFTSMYVRTYTTSAKVFEPFSRFYLSNANSTRQNSANTKWHRSKLAPLDSPWKTEQTMWYRFPLFEIMGKIWALTQGGGTAKTLPSRDFRDESFGVAASKWLPFISCASESQ